jgi:endoglucanase
MTARGRTLVLTAMAAVAAMVLLICGAAGGHATHARSADAVARQAEVCPDRYPAKRTPGNPLMLPQAPGSNPLRGAQFFVDGPRHGSAAGAIAQLLPAARNGGSAGSVRVVPRTLEQFPEDLSWASYERHVNNVIKGKKGSAAYDIRMLEKIADQPEALRFSTGAGGGGPGATYGQVQKILCKNLTADPGSIPIISTYFLHPLAPGCQSKAAFEAIGPKFRRQIDEVAAGVGNRPAVFLLEIDGLGSSRCVIHSAARSVYEADLRYEIDKISALPHTVVYMEGGYSDSNSPAYTAGVLNAIGIRKIRGFYTNDTHLQWTAKEAKWAQRVSAKTHGAHFLINTSENGQGPKLNPHPITQGVENLCNPPGRGLGPKPTTSTPFAHSDGFVWQHVPGNSSGCGGGPPGGTFWLAKAVGLASRANQKLGPGYPSRPY